MFFTVIIHLITVLSNGYRHINRFNGLITVGHFKGHRSEVVVGIGELFGSQTHESGTSIRSSGHSITAEDKVRIIACHRI